MPFSLNLTIDITKKLIRAIKKPFELNNEQTILSSDNIIFHADGIDKNMCRREREPE